MLERENFEPPRVQRERERERKEKERECLGHRMARIAVTAVKFGRAPHPRIVDGSTGGKHMPAGKERAKIQQPRRTQEGWMESSRGGKWKNRQYESCHAEALGSSERCGDGTFAESVGRSTAGTRGS